MKGLMVLYLNMTYLVFWVSGISLVIVLGGIYLYLRVYGQELLRTIILGYLKLYENGFHSHTPVITGQFWLFQEQRIRHSSGAYLYLEPNGQCVEVRLPNGKTIRKRLAAPEDFALSALYHQSPAKALLIYFTNLVGQNWNIYIRLESPGRAFVEIYSRQFTN